MKKIKNGMDNSWPSTHGGPWGAHGDPWVPMDAHGDPWGSMDLMRLWGSMDPVAPWTHGGPCGSMDPWAHGPMRLHGPYGALQNLKMLDPNCWKICKC